MSDKPFDQREHLLTDLARILERKAAEAFEIDQPERAAAFAQAAALYRCASVLSGIESILEHEFDFEPST